MKQIGITSYGDGGCAETYGIPWYLKPFAFKESIYKIIQNGTYYNYHKYAADLNMTLPAGVNDTVPMILGNGTANTNENNTVSLNETAGISVNSTS